MKSSKFIDPQGEPRQLSWLAMERRARTAALEVVLTNASQIADGVIGLVMIAGISYLLPAILGVLLAPH